MDAFFDFILSNQFIFLGIIVTFVVLAGLAFSKKLIKAKKPSRVLGVFFVLIPIVIVSMISSGPYGGAVEFMSIKTNGKEIALIETHTVGDEDEGTTETKYRLYVIDAKTGKRLVREVLRYTDLLCVNDRGTVVFESTWATLYDNHTGEEIHTWSKNRGFEKYDELKGGVSNLERELVMDNGKEKAYLTITAMDGRAFYLDLADERLYPGKIKTSRSAGPDYRFNFSRREGKIETLNIRKDAEKSRNFDGTFLDPTIVTQDNVGQFIVVQHYASLKKDDAIFTAISFDAQKKWEITQQQLNLSSRSLDVACFANDRLYAAFGGTVVCVDVASGSPLWTVKL